MYEGPPCFPLSLPSLSSRLHAAREQVLLGMCSSIVNLLKPEQERNIVVDVNLMKAYFTILCQSVDTLQEGKK